MKFRWSVAAAQPAVASGLVSGLGIPPLLAQCLVNRRICDCTLAQSYLEPRLRQLADPFLIRDMDRAVDRLLAARTRRERIVVFGDYDVDGVTSTALLLEVLTTLGCCAEWYLPRRFDEGYGLSKDAVENCLARSQMEVLLAVDCGSNSVDCIGYLQQRGIDVIVLDHHQPCWPAPQPFAFINPLAAKAMAPAPLELSPDGAPPFAELCSVGLSFKLAHALVKRGRLDGLPGAAEFDVRPLLDLVALGTIADLVPLTGENRILVSAGLARLRVSERPGLSALRAVARCSGELGPREVGFQLAPRLNAAGRLETAEAALSLLRCRNPTEARRLAEALDTCNRERQNLERTIAEQAMQRVRARFDPDRDFAIVEGAAEWHIGVVGIVASRVARAFHRPTFILGGDGEALRGSGRSVEGFDLAAALGECKDLLGRAGGHAMAAGVGLATTNVDAFRERLNATARRWLKPEDLQPRLYLDAEVKLAEITPGCLDGLARLNPSGPGNRGVQFAARNLRHAHPPQRIGSTKQHLKMWVTDGQATTEVVWWDPGSAQVPEGFFDLAFVPSVNEYQGWKTVQLQVLDWRPTA
jgi:single-stranded-DNA-specific exonuclease